MEPGEVGIEITPILSASSPEPEFAAQLDALLRRTCRIARALTSAELAAAKLWIGDKSQARKYFSMSEKYAAFRDFRVDPRGDGLHGMRIAPGEVIRLTDAEVLSHPLYQAFGPFADAHPPMRGWLATSVCGDGGRRHGMLQLSDKSSGRDFDEADEANIRELAALIGETLDALRLAAQRRA
ncbi:GAF domain-containing protein [Agromyces mariniharenae]|uniref:GAF domain-containing protein n=1 Tax=Agromyces mariniharenae TaxID=2604423 RepID=A0A5S4V8I2_9MICO|nr:GAF domain-containing protein [Agromyces mariniharenae]TYL52880.1 GAF domain-containing protein [Agromyces mariniharenae]